MAIHAHTLMLAMRFLHGRYASHAWLAGMRLAHGSYASRAWLLFAASRRGARERGSASAGARTLDRLDRLDDDDDGLDGLDGLDDDGNDDDGDDYNDKRIMVDDGLPRYTGLTAKQRRMLL